MLKRHQLPLMAISLPKPAFTLLELLLAISIYGVVFVTTSLFIINPAILLQHIIEHKNNAEKLTVMMAGLESDLRGPTANVTIDDNSLKITTAKQQISYRCEPNKNNLYKHIARQSHIVIDNLASCNFAKYTIDATQTLISIHIKLNPDITAYNEVYINNLTEQV